MCGIVGVYRRADAAPVEPDRFAAALQRMQRRGPDDSGTWQDESVHFGHRRLAVIDLSANGHQPMVSHDGRFVVVFNGEIFNHLELRSALPAVQWRGESDTETLLEAYRVWGTGCLQRLNGMYAFAIWDRAERRLFAARDRLGKKPLYYSWDGHRFAFASRPRALADLLQQGTLDIEPAALRAYLELGYIPAPLSFYRGVHKLQQAHYILLDDAGMRVERYWDYRQIAIDRSLLNRGEDDLADELEERIRRAVKLRLISDVPLGAFLSGGIDSAMIVAAMKSLGLAEPRTFTIGFNESAYDEGPAALAIARHLGVDHVQETLGVDDLLDLLPTYVEEFDEPFADSSAFPTMAVARLARRHVTVALTGDGGDELFGGYHYYRLVGSLSRIASLPRLMRYGVRNVVSRVPGHRAKLLAGVLNHDSPASVFHFMRSFGKDFGSMLRDDPSAAKQDAARGFEDTALHFPRDLASAEIGMRLDMQYTLADDYLQKVDVATMAYSLEARCPLLDHTLVEWATALPLRYKISHGQAKYLLKKVLTRSLPPELVYRPKRGFGAPTAEWLRGPLKAWALEILNDQAVMSRVPLDKARVLELFRLHASRDRDAHPLLWAVLMLLGFVSHHVVGESLPSVARRQAA
ncbi:MAG: asparagine synthase (glutamine-hydrolyzing) [Nevskia sp.]|nr:asparagine synthase (glutamine-hydrolyzing) [Nevskia sp.]